MNDILSQGGGDEPSRWPRRLAAIVILVLLAVVIVRHLPRGRDAHAAVPPPPGAAVTASRVPLLVPTKRSGSAVIVLPGQPDGLTGSASPWDGRLRLPVAGEQPVWFWPATGSTAPIGRLPKDRLGYVFIRVDGGWAVQPDAATRPDCGGCTGLPSPVYFLADGAKSVTDVGTADVVAPAAAARALWLVSYPSAAGQGAVAAIAQEVSATGARLGSPLRLPAGYRLDRATERGLLLTPVIQRQGLGTSELWDPAGRRVSRTFSGVIAASSGAIAWAPPCASLCLVRVLDLATGRVTVVRLPQGGSATSAAFSPDGHFLALELSFGEVGNGGGLVMQLEVASVATGRPTVVPGIWASGYALVGFGWPVASDSLVAELSFTTKVQVASWHPGAAKLSVAVVRPRSDPAALVVG